MTKIDRPAWLERLDALAGEAESHGLTRLAEIVRGLALHIRAPLLETFANRAEALIATPEVDPLEPLVRAMIRGGELRLWTGNFSFTDVRSLCTIVDEILLRQEYWFRSESDAPTVIDAGANTGLATYYVKRTCKAGRVICFEPDPDNFALLEANIAASNFEDVELHRAALSTQDGEALFQGRPDAPLAGSLAPRAPTGDEVAVPVKTLRLAAFLDQPVGLLKLDIEGAEADVLEDCADHLDQVENVFVEVHPVPGEAPSLLARVLAVLEGAGFSVHVARSPWSERAHRVRPLTHAARTYSLSVFATRLPPAG